MTSPERFAVVMPAHNAGGEIAECIAAIVAAGFPAQAITVVDDGSRDDTGAIATEAGARVVRNDVAEGPARARNRGVAAVDAEVVVFVDADVVVAPGARDRLAAHFADPSITAVFGSYDTAPRAPSVVSRYRNLLHHHVHQRAKREARTFWTGFGAVRRRRFLDIGGLDPAWQAIEDVEFGVRLRAAGCRIVLDPDLLATHLKDWTVRSMFRTDLWGRAVPFSRLMLAGAWRPDDLNGTWAHRASAAAVIAAPLGLLLAPFSAAGLPVALAAVIAFALANAGFLATLARIAGPGFALAALPFHALHYVAAVAGLAYVALREWRPWRRGTTVEAASR